jgi:DNA repair exonuclease SbcCD nuclease subunit
MKEFSFVHAGDLHLDSPFRGISTKAPSVVAAALRSATFAAFESLVRLCLEEDVLFLAVAGDVYDSADRSVRAQLAFRDGLKVLAERGVRTFLVHGNHDPLDGWASNLSWPEGVTVFGGEDVSTSIVEAKGVPVAAISGISYRRSAEHRNLSSLFQARHPQLFQAALMHANCGGNRDHEAYAPCRLSDLRGKGFDYWALGHVHERAVLSESPLVVYPGNIQGLNIRETGPRGCSLVRVDSSGRAAVAFRALDAVRWLTGEVSIAGLETIDALDDRIAAAVETLSAEGDGRPSIARLSLTGRGTLSPSLRKEGVVDDFLERARDTGLGISPFIWIENIAVDCLPEVDLEERAGVDDFLGQVLRLARETAELIPAEGGEGAVPEELLAAFSELYGHRRASKHLDLLTPANLRTLLAQAEMLSLDLLEPME